jgi:uncharacterized RDD family membrane protein YckC
LTYSSVPAGLAPAREEVVYAGWSRRVAAHLLDGVIVTVAVLLVVWLAMPAADDAAAEDSRSGLVGLLLIAGWVAYWVLGWGGLSGQTPGKKALSIAVRRTDGSRLGYGRAFWRVIVMQVLWILVPLGILAALWPLWDRRKQSGWDKLSGSVVVHRSAVAPTVREPAPLTGHVVALAAGSPLAPRREQRPPSSRLDETTRARYERGEISQEEYERLQAFQERIRGETS